MVTSVQLNDIFLPFYNDDLLGGTLRFEWVDPIDRESTVEMRFTEAPSWSAVGHDFFDLVMVLEVLP